MKAQSTNISDKEKTKKQWHAVWIRAWISISGLFALLWLIFRSGTKPSRFTYPCQRAALYTASMAFGVPLTAFLLKARRGVGAAVRSPLTYVLSILGIAVTLCMGAYLSQAGDYRGPVMAPPPDYRAAVYQVSACAEDPIGQRFVGVERLLVNMGQQGLKFYRTDTESLLSGPEGVISADDVVIIKINYQWEERGGTNTDVLQAVIQSITDHPDIFTGEIVVCENAQFRSVADFDRDNNNARDHGLSPLDIVTEFKDRDYRISLYDWTPLRFTQVNEYSGGDMDDGYIVYDYNEEYEGRVSYPKFTTEYETLISLKYGLWDVNSETYDPAHLKYINLPVFKSHGYEYGATAAVKNYMGVVTRELETNSHAAVRFGIMGAALVEFGMADLNILDAIWVNANPADGPWTDYAGATRLDSLAAYTDPIAGDIWAVTNILIPAFQGNGFHDYPKADPEDPGSDFRQYLDTSMYQLLAAGFDVTNDLAKIDAYQWIPGDLDGDSDVDIDDFNAFSDCYFETQHNLLETACLAADFDCDLDVDCDDWDLFKSAWTAAGEPPDFASCDRFGCTIVMPSHDYAPGDTCYCDVIVTNPSDTSYPETPVFVLLDVFGTYYFAPGFSGFDYYENDVNPGTQIISVLPEFEWPPGAGTVAGILWYAAMTNPSMTALLGELDTFTFGWHE
jgi:uncharacterized protein (DUF362 family)